MSDHTDLMQFEDCLVADFKRHGTAAIKELREARPLEYLKLIKTFLERHDFERNRAEERARINARLKA